MVAWLLMAYALVKAEETMGRKNRRRKHKGHRSSNSNGNDGFAAMDRKAKHIEAKQKKKERKQSKNEPVYNPFADMVIPPEIEIPMWPGDM